MFIFLVILTGLSLWAVIASVVSVTRDGYRRVPARPERAYAGEGERKRVHLHRHALHG